MNAVICDIDGVILIGNEPIDGSPEFLHRLLKKEIPFLLLTNYPSQTPSDLQLRFSSAGIDCTCYEVLHLGNGDGSVPSKARRP